MSYTNYPSTGSAPQQEAPKDNRKLIYGLLIAALLGTWGYVVYDKSKSKETITQLQTQYSNVDSARNEIQEEYNDALARMDSLTGSNTQLSAELTERQKELEKAKANIKAELGKKNADISKLKTMLADFKGQVDNLYVEIEKLKAENQELTATNQRVTAERDTVAAQKQVVEQSLATTQQEKAHVEDIGSTLHASNINITAIDVKNSGKEKATSTAKRVDVFRVSFDLDENRIAPSGTKELYVSVTGPDGKPITVPASSGTFASRDEGDKVFTNKVTVQYEQGKRTPVSFDWKPEAGKYQTGNYKVEIYQNGFKIGEGTKALKKGGIFG
jgi:peptidoglycan hydrolase CwlO-like protein